METTAENRTYTHELERICLHGEWFTLRADNVGQRYGRAYAICRKGDGPFGWVVFLGPFGAKSRAKVVWAGFVAQQLAAGSTDVGSRP